MNISVRRGAVLVLLVLFVACGSPGPTSPTTPPPPSAPPPPAAPPPQIDFPPSAGPSRTFIFDRELSYPVRDFTRKSHLVLYDNGALELRYPPSDYGSGVYRGAYQDDGGAIRVLFESQARNDDDLWDATGTLQGDWLALEYDEIMQHSDFENAVYVLTR